MGADVGRVAVPTSAPAIAAFDADVADAEFSDAGLPRGADLEFSDGREALCVFAVREPLLDFAPGSALAIFVADWTFAIFEDRVTFAPPFIFATHSTLPRLQRV